MAADRSATPPLMLDDAEYLADLEELLAYEAKIAPPPPRSEKEYLQVQVNELETQLSRLKNELGIDSSANGSGLEDTSHPTHYVDWSGSLWDWVQAEKKRAAQEPCELLKNQLLVAHSLEKILLERSIEPPCSLFDFNKRARVEVVEAEEDSLRVESPPSRSALEAQFTETVAVMEACGLADARVDSDNAVAKLDENDGLFLEFTLARVLPLSPQDVASIAWKRMQWRQVEWTSDFQSTTKGSPRKFSIDYETNSRVRSMSVMFHGRGGGARRKEESGSLLFVWQIETTATGYAFRDQRVWLHERSYLVLTPSNGLDGTTGTVLKSCVRTWPQWEGEQRPPMNVLIDLVLSSCYRNMEVVLRKNEFALLRERRRQEELDDD